VLLEAVLRRFGPIAHLAEAGEVYHGLPMGLPM
jgi:hypothetical protein